MAFFIHVLFYIYIALSCSLLSPPKYSNNSSPCSAYGFVIQWHAEEHDNSPSIVTSPKLHRRDCLVCFPQAPVPLAALLQRAKSQRLGEPVLCWHQAPGKKKMWMFMVEPHKNQMLSPSSYEHSTGKQILDWFILQSSICSFQTYRVRKTSLPFL